VEGWFDRISGGAFAVAATIVTGLLLVVLVGLVFPVVHTYCLVDRRPTHTRIESKWEFNWIGGGFPNPAPDTEDCVRNTPTREALSALGIWKLGSPEHQVAANVLE